MTLHEAISTYLLALRHEQGAAKTTQKQYQSQLRHFHDWLLLNGYPEPQITDVTPPVLRRFLHYLSGKGLRPRTIRSYFHPLRGLAAYLVTLGEWTDNPTSSIALPKKDAAQRQTVSDEEVRTLLDACERQRNPRKIALHRAVLSVLIYGGLRRAELCDLYVSDLEVQEKSLLIRSGKGSKSRKIYLPDKAIGALKEWLVLRPRCTHPYLFAYDRQRRLCFRGLHSLVEEVKCIAGYMGRENIKPHSLRHWRATDLLRSGANIRDIQAFLGHTQMQTTAIYLHADEHQLKAIADLSQLSGRSSQSTIPDATAKRKNCLERSRRRTLTR